MNKTEITNKNNVKTPRFIILSLLIIVLTIIPLASATYTVANNYNPIGSFIGGWTGSNPGQFDTSMCQAGQDLVVQIAPFGCTPAVVRSDLLEEQNVPVFCQLSATQINPLVNVNYINQISITGQYPSSVSTVGFHPAQAALQPASGNINSPVLNNLGYAAIVLSRQPDESAMPDYIEGNLTVKIRYDIQNAFGVGKSTFYLPLISDETDWQSKYTSYGFWNGRGFLRADAIDTDSASISLYAGSSPYDSGDVQRQSTVPLNKGETSGEIPVHGFDFCYANLKLKLDDLVNPDTRAQIKINGDLIEVSQGETFLDGKCQVTGIEKIGVGERVGLRCQEDGKTGLFSSTTPFALSRNPRINISINGEEKDVGIGDYLYESKDDGGKIGYIYIGYIGSSTGSSDMEDLFMYLVNADYKKEKLDNGDIEMATRLSDYYTSGSKTGVITIDFFKSGINGALRLSQQTLSNIFSANRYYLFNFEDIESKESVYGANIKINNFANPLNTALNSEATENYKDALADYEEIIKSYSKETYNNIKLGESAFIQEIELANSLGQKRTMLDLCQKFKEQYPSSGYYATSDCNNGLRLSSSASSSKSVVINGKTKIISLEGIYNPSFDDFGARVKIEWDEKDSAGNAVHKTDTYDITKDKVITFGSNNENIQLADIDDDTTADFIINVPSGSSATGLIDTLTSNKESLELGITEAVRAYKFTMLKLNIKKVAKVSVLPNIDYAESEATFPFKIGIEKRGIKLSPEKTQERINSLNSTIEKWDKISGNLGKVVQGLKTACLATEGLFTVQNFFANLGGEGIARTKVMRDAGGWYDQCDELVRKGDYSSQHDCLSSNSEEIDAQVNSYLQIINAQDAQFESLQEGITTSNGLFSSDTIDTGKLIEKYSPRVENALTSFGNIVDANDQNPISIEDLKTEISYNTWKSQKNYELNDLRELEFYANAVKKNPNDKAAKARLYAIASEIHANSEGAVEAQNLANTLKIDQSKIGFLEIGKTRSFPYTGIVYSDIKSGIFISGIADNGPVAVVQTNLAEKYIVVLDGSGSEKQLPVKRVDGIFQVYNANTRVLMDDSALPDELKGGVVFEKFDSSTYNNKYTNPEIRYYETEPYKGYPAIVPFDADKGWYAGIRQTLPILGNIGSYDASGRAASFYLCNVGADGKESFLSGGDDTCQMINLAQRQTFNQFYGLSTSETNSLVDKAVNAIESAQRAYKDGVDKVTIGGKSYDVGNPASDLPEMQCEDFMSPSQCQILFNVCDPVICPSSRCDLGGQYPVRDVIQSGIVGSIALCLPNAREGIVMPVCLTGIQAGVDSWNSVLTSYRDCLQENLDTGKTTGICDEINSVYTCEFFWKQGLPIAQVAVPKIISSLLGQNVHGGGEYLSVQNAWSNAEKSVGYFTQYYAANSFTAFKARSLEEAGTPICRSYVSAVYPSGGNLLNTLTQPDSPPQFTGRFDEIPFTTQTNPPTSQYKVFYHIYAGKDSGAYYSVYLKGVPGSSYYQDTSINRIVASGYISAGDYATNTPDFTASSGYSQMCIVVNGQPPVCGFKEVSTDFALNYVNEQYLSEQASKTDITSESSCISGDASIYNFLNPNVESTANSLIDPQLYNSGITRICATNNPGKGTDNLYGQEGQRWIEVGYCEDKNIKCWVDTKSVKDSIKITGIEDQTLQDLTEEQLQLMQGTDYSKQFVQAIKDIEKEKDNYNKAGIITSLLDTKKFFFNQQVAYLLFLRGNAISEIAKSLYKPVNDAATIKQQDELGDSSQITPSPGSNNPSTAASVSLEEIEKKEPPVIQDSLSPVEVRIVTYSTFGDNFFGDMFSSDLVYQWNGIAWTFGRDNTKGTTIYAQGLSEINNLVYEYEGKKQLNSIAVECGENQFTIATSYSLFSTDIIGGIDNYIRQNCAVKSSGTGTNTGASNTNGTTTSASGFSCTTQESCQKVLGAEIIKIAKQMKTENEIDDKALRDQTGAKNFECLILQQSLQESFIQHCTEFKDSSGDPLYCDKEIENVLKSSAPGENSYGVMQLNQKFFSTSVSSDFVQNVKAGINYLIFSYRDESKEFVCNGKSYFGWKAALRYYNGWATDCTKGDLNYVENILNKKDAVIDIFPECA